MLGLSVIASLAGESLIKGLMAGVLGLMIATIGTDPVTGVNRFTFGDPDLLSGIPPHSRHGRAVTPSRELFEQTSAAGLAPEARRSDARISCRTPHDARTLARVAGDRLA